MSGTRHSQSNLMDVLDEQIRCAKAMLGALQMENRALLDGDPECLNAAGADKAQLFESLEALEVERRGLTDALEIRLSAAADTDTAVKWRELLAIIDECKQRNQFNGSMVKARTEQVQTALKLLRGDELDLYGASGLELAQQNARRLGSA